MGGVGGQLRKANISHSGKLHVAQVVTPMQGEVGDSSFLNPFSFIAAGWDGATVLVKASDPGCPDTAVQSRLGDLADHQRRRERAGRRTETDGNCLIRLSAFAVSRR